MGSQACGRSTTRAPSPEMGLSAVVWRDIQYTPACRNVEARIPYDNLADFWSAARRMESWPQGRSNLAYSFCLAYKPSMDDSPLSRVRDHGRLPTAVRRRAAILAGMPP